MLYKQNPAPREGGERAGNRYAQQPSLTQTERRTQEQLQLRRQRLVERLHRLGARVTFEFIAEIAERFDISDQVDERLSAYTSRLSLQMLRVSGSDHFPPTPMRRVGGVR
jgi:hypothetical protein